MHPTDAILIAQELLMDAAMFHHQQEEEEGMTPRQDTTFRIPRYFTWVGGGLFAGTVAMLTISVLADCGILPRSAKPTLWGWIVGEAVCLISASGAIHRSKKPAFPLEGEDDTPIITASVRGGRFDDRLQRGYLILQLTPSQEPERQALHALNASQQPPLPQVLQAYDSANYELPTGRQSAEAARIQPTALPTFLRRESGNGAVAPTASAPLLPAPMAAERPLEQAHSRGNSSAASSSEALLDSLYPPEEEPLPQSAEMDLDPNEDAWAGDASGLQNSHVPAGHRTVGAYR